MERLSEVKALTFDLFGTVLDLGTSLTPAIGKFLKSKGSDAATADILRLRAGDLYGP